MVASETPSDGPVWVEGPWLPWRESMPVWAHRDLWKLRNIQWYGTDAPTGPLFEGHTLYAPESEHYGLVLPETHCYEVLVGRADGTIDSVVLWKDIPFGGKL